MVLRKITTNRNDTRYLIRKGYYVPMQHSNSNLTNLESYPHMLQNQSNVCQMVQHMIKEERKRSGTLRNDLAGLAFSTFSKHHLACIKFEYPKNKWEQKEMKRLFENNIYFVFQARKRAVKELIDEWNVALCEIQIVRCKFQRNFKDWIQNTYLRMITLWWCLECYIYELIQGNHHRLTSTRQMFLILRRCWKF